MNERIKDLIDQAQKVVGYTDGDYIEIKALDPEKFVELIVKECIDNVELWERDSRNHISYMLKNHYGVK